MVKVKFPFSGVFRSFDKLSSKWKPVRQSPLLIIDIARTIATISSVLMLKVVIALHCCKIIQSSYGIAVRKLHQHCDLIGLQTFAQHEHGA